MNTCHKQSINQTQPTWFSAERREKGIGLTQNAEKKGGKLNKTAFEQKAIFSIL